MRRVLAMLASAGLLLASGCGVKSYELRLTSTLDEMRYQERLNKNLMPAETKPKWEELSIFLRPPKSLQPVKAWPLSPTEPGKFDLEASFQDSKQPAINLHVLGRIKRPKNAPKKKGAPTAADTADRSNFPRDVLGVLTASYSPPDELMISKFKTQTVKNNEYKFYTFTANDKNIQVYLTSKKEPYDVALIFEFPKAELGTLSSKIELCLGSFAVDQKARRFFSGSTSENEPEGAPAGPSGVAF